VDRFCFPSTRLHGSFHSFVSQGHFVSPSDTLSPPPESFVFTEPSSNFPQPARVLFNNVFGFPPAPVPNLPLAATSSANLPVFASSQAWLAPSHLSLCTDLSSTQSLQTATASSPSHYPTATPSHFLLPPSTRAGTGTLPTTYLSPHRSLPPPSPHGSVPTDLSTQAFCFSDSPTSALLTLPTASMSSAASLRAAVNASPHAAAPPHSGRFGSARTSASAPASPSRERATSLSSSDATTCRTSCAPFSVWPAGRATPATLSWVASTSTSSMLSASLAASSSSRFYSPPLPAASTDVPETAFSPASAPTAHLVPAAGVAARPTRPAPPVPPINTARSGSSPASSAVLAAASSTSPNPQTARVDIFSGTASWCSSLSARERCTAAQVPPPLPTQPTPLFALLPAWGSESDLVSARRWPAAGDDGTGADARRPVDTWHPSSLIGVRAGLPTDIGADAHGSTWKVPCIGCTREEGVQVDAKQLATTRRDEHEVTTHSTTSSTLTRREPHSLLPLKKSDLTANLAGSSRAGQSSRSLLEIQRLAPMPSPPPLPPHPPPRLPLAATPRRTTSWDAVAAAGAPHSSTQPRLGLREAGVERSAVSAEMERSGHSPKRRETEPPRGLRRGNAGSEDTVGDFKCQGNLGTTRRCSSSPARAGECQHGVLRSGGSVLAAADSEARRILERDAAAANAGGARGASTLEGGLFTTAPDATPFTSPPLSARAPRTNAVEGPMVLSSSTGSTDLNRTTAPPPGRLTANLSEPLGDGEVPSTPSTPLPCGDSSANSLLHRSPTATVAVDAGETTARWVSYVGLPASLSQLAVPPQTPSAVRHSPPRRAVSFNVSQSKRPGLPASPPMPPKRPPTAPPLPHVSPRTAAVLSEPQQQFLTRPTWLNSGGSNTGGGRGAQGESPRQRLRVTSALTSQAVVPGSVESPPAESVKGGVPLSPASARVPGSFAIVPVSVSPRQPAPATVLVAPPRGSPIGCPCTLHSPSDGSCADAYTTAHHGGCGARCGDADDDDARFGINCGVVERAYTPGGGDDASAGSLVLSPTVSPQRIPHFPGGLDPPVTTVPPGDRDAAQTSSNYLAPLDSSAPGSPASTPHQTPPQLPPSLAPAPQQPIPPQQQQHHRHQLRMLSPLPRHPRAPSSIAHHLGGGSPPPSTRRRPYGGLAQLRSLLADSDDEPLPPLASDVAGGRPSEHGDEGETEPGSRHSPGGTSAVDGWRTGPAPRRRRRRIGTTEEPAGTSPRGANETSLVTAEAERTRSGHTSPEQCPRSVSSPPLTAAQPLRGPRSLTAVDSPRYSSPPLQFSSRFSDNVGTMADTSPSPPSVVKPSVRAADAPCPPPTHGWATGHSVIPVPRLILPGDTTPTPLGAAADVASGSTSAGSPITPSPPASALAPAELHEASPTVVLEWWVNGPPQPLPPTTAGADESARTSSATIATGAVSCGDDSSGRQGGMALTSHKSDCSCSSTPQLALAHRARPVPPPPRPLPFTPVTLSPPAAPLFSPLPLLPVLPDAAKPLPPSASSPVAPVVVASCAASHEQEQATAIEGWHSPHRRAQASPGSGSEQPDTMSPPPPEETSAQQRSAVPSAATGLQPFFGQAAGQAPRKNETTTRAGRPQQPLRLSPEHSLHQPKHHRLAPRRRPRLPTVVLRPAVVPFSPPPFLRAPACSAAPPPPCRRPRSPPGCTEGRTASPGGRQTRAGTGNEGTHEEKSEGEKEGEQRGECKIADARRPPSEGGRLAEDTKAPRGEREAKEIAESAVWAQRLEKAGHETANREVNSAPGPRHTRTKAAIDEGMIDHDVSATSATLPTAQHVATPARPRETAATSHQPVPSGVPGNADATTLMRSPHRDSGGGSEPLSVGVEAVPSHKLHGTSTTPEGRRPLTAVRCLAHGIPWGNVSARAPSPPARRAVGPPTSAKSQRRAPVPQHQQQQQQPQLQPQKQQQHCQHGIRQQTQPEAPPPPPSPQLTLLPSPSPPPPPLPHSPTETPLFIEGTTSARLAEPPALSTAATITATSSAITTSAAVAVTRSVSAHLTPHPSTSAGSPPSPLPPQLPPPSALPAAPSLLLPIATSTAAFPTAAGADVNAAGSIASSAPAATAAGPLAPLRARAVSDAAISNITVLSSCDLLDGAAALQLGSSLLEYTFGAPATPVLAGTTLEAANNSTAAASPRCTLHNSLTLSSSAQQQGPSLPAPTSAVSPRPQCTCTQAGSPGSISPQGGTSSPGRSAPPGGDMSASWGSLAVLAREGADPWGDARLQVPAVEAAGGHGEGWGAGAIRRSALALSFSPNI